MRIAVIGTGGVGGYFGARLALACHDVVFVARGAHLDAIRKHGLEVEHASATMHVANAQATDDIASIGPVDIAMVCTKLWDVEPIAPKLVPLVKDGGLAIPFQNGIEAPDMLRNALGRDHVAGGIAYIAANIGAPGVIAVQNPLNRLRIGSFFGIGESRINAFAAAGRDAGINVEVADDIRLALWEKFAMFAAMSGVTALSRQRIGVVRGDPELRALFERAVVEAVAVARAEGVTLPGDYVGKQLAFIDALAPEATASMARDLEGGHRLELPWLSGAIARLGRKHGVPTPIHDTVYAALKPYANGTPH